MSSLALEVLLMAECSATEKLVMLVLARHGRDPTGSDGFPGIRRIAKIAGISTSTTQLTLRAMRAKGWLTWSSGNARERIANHYIINIDQIPRLQLDEPVSATATDPYRPPLQPWIVDRHSSVSGPVSVVTTEALEALSEKNPRPSGRLETSLPPATEDQAQAVVDMWNRITAGKLPSVRLTERRAIAINGRLRDTSWLLEFERACYHVASCERYQGHNPSGWICRFDVMLEGDHATEISEKAAQEAAIAHAHSRHASTNGHHRGGFHGTSKGDINAALYDEFAAENSQGARDCSDPSESGTRSADARALRETTGRREH